MALERPKRDFLDKIFVDEAVAELRTIQDMLRWTMSRFNAADIYYGHGSDNAWDEALQLVLPTLYLPLDLPDAMLASKLTSSERHRIIDRVLRRINDHSGGLFNEPLLVLWT